ncbi:hypothetical protein DVK07_11320 [Halorubrum sp. Atlit-26R]|nr:hypothetical protein DVK07_11320 [Halorubrum sp. Atlit-26R]
MFSVDQLSSIYKRAIGALSVFAGDPLAAIYKRSTRALEKSAVDPRSITHCGTFLYRRSGTYR